MTLRVCFVLYATMFGIKKLIKNLFINLVRQTEEFLSGQSGYKLIKKPFEIDPSQVIKDNVTANNLLKEIKQSLALKYAIEICCPVLLEVVADAKKNRVTFVWKEDGIGKYHSQMMIDQKYHMIYIVEGLSKYKFCAIIAHELMHAFLYEKNLFTQSQPFREAMARWIEYHILMSFNMKEQALRLLEIKAPERGGKLYKLLELEKKTGKNGLIPFLLEKSNSGLTTV